MKTHETESQADNNNDTALQELIRRVNRPELERFVEAFPLKVKIIKIHGVEITQGIQTYRASEHLSGPPGDRWDNTVRTVAKKPTWVRVYLRNQFFPNFANVTGTLTIYKRRFGRFYTQVTQISPEAPGVADAPLDADYATERGTLDSTLNFVVPANLMCGHLRFEVEINAGNLTDRYTRKVNATLEQTLTMRVIPVSYSGVDSSGSPLTLPSTSLADAQSTAAWSTAVYPVQTTPNISLGTGVQLTFPLTGAPASAGGCAQSWISLNTLVNAARIADGNLPQTFYYGLVPSAVPIGTNSGCASSGVTSGRVGGQVTMAHEFGHALGFGHSSCGGVGASADSSVPIYEPYDQPNQSMASIGEYGLDVRNGQIFSPDSTFDYMSYCWPKWISIYNYERAVQHGRLKPRFICNDRPLHDFNYPVLDPGSVFVDDPVEPIPEPEPPRPPWLDDARPILPDNMVAVMSLIAIIDEDDIEIRSMTRAKVVPTIEHATKTDMVAAICDGKGKVLSSAPLMKLHSTGHSGCGGCGGCGGCENHDDNDSGPAIVQALIPDKAKGQCMQILKDGKPVAKVNRPKNPPNSPRISSKQGKDGKVSITWKSKKSKQANEVWLQWRGCKRSDPKVILVGGNSGTHTVEPGSLPSGKCYFEAVVHDGFDSSISDSLSVDIPTAPPSVAIMHPYHHQTLQFGMPMQLHGLVTDAMGNTSNPENCYWLLDGKELAQGLENYVPTPKPGLHKITLVVKDSSGSYSTESEINVIE